MTTNKNQSSEDTPDLTREQSDSFLDSITENTMRGDTDDDDDEKEDDDDEG